MASTIDKIMEATCTVLAEEGYARFSLAKVAAHTDRSKSAILYHFDSKSDLLQAFLDHLGDRLEEELEGTDGADPETRLQHLIDTMIATEKDEQAFHKALFELRSQTGNNTVIQDAFNDIDAKIRDRIAAALEEMRDDEPGKSADLIFATITGIMYTYAFRATDSDHVDELKDELLDSIPASVHDTSR